MTDSEIFQDLCNVFGIHGTLKHPVDVPTFLAGAHSLRELGPRADTEPQHIQQCIAKVYQSLGADYFQQLFDTPADVDDFWTGYFCPQPAGTDLSKADCPAGTHPLWTNGKVTVFVRPARDKHGNLVFDFSTR
jgi:hypothetical protein